MAVKSSNFVIEQFNSMLFSRQKYYTSPAKMTSLVFGVNLLNILITEVAMTRARKARASITHNPPEGEAESDQANRTTGRSITDLPRFISESLLLFLSVNTLLICRCVCKTWRNIISSPEFAKLHFARAEVYPLVRSLSKTHISRTLYLIEPRNCNFASNEVGNQIKIKLVTKLKIPLRNFDIALRDIDLRNVCSNVGSKRKRCAKVRTTDQRFYVANTCNGLLCLSEPLRNEQLAVCNPITGEFIKLPTPTLGEEGKRMLVECGLGFSPQTNEYKVIRMFEELDYDRLRYDLTEDPITGELQCGFRYRVTEIHTLGTRSWRRIGPAPSSSSKLGFPTYLNGALHWLYLDQPWLDKIISFDFVTEKFRPIPPPPDKYKMFGLSTSHDISLGTLRGCLCLYVSVEGTILIYVMKDYGVQGSWTIELRLTTRTPAGRWLEGVYEPMSVLSNGCLLVSHPGSNGLFYYFSDGSSFKFLKLCGAKSKYGVIAYIPSFISLKDVISGDNVRVPNINSRCAGLKLEGETKPLFLEEKDANVDTDFYMPEFYPDDEFDDDDIDNDECW